MASGEKIKIAIIGGGLAGATLMNALSSVKHTHLDVDLFESAPEFSERGAAVGIAQNGQRAMVEIGGAVAGALERAGGVTMSSSRICLASGPSALSKVLDLAPEKRGKVVHRAALLSELLKPIDPAKMHTNKKVVRIEELESDRLLVHFEDGSTFKVDAAIGADGVHGHVREHVLGADHPALKATFAGFWDSRSLVPMKKAKELLGEDKFEVQRQYGWIGDGGFFMHDVLDGEETVQCVVAGMADDWGENEWKRELNKDLLEEAVGKWTDTPIKSGMIQAMLENPDLKAFAEWHHKVDAPTYTKGPVCLMGDSAHSMTPWQGSGAGQCIEDTMILQTLLEQVKYRKHLAAAFEAYDQVRRPRTQKIIESSHGTGVILCGRGPNTGLDLEEIQKVLGHRWDHIHSLDLEEHKRQALAALQARI
ncbi:hypothetical protein BCR34DRAFT_255081 [Clohesyomyces aquaticus]|uniref:FAD-binding domain-containing protein n=1 Tax=Clohesyomyces aquaticus TaxID=1231657 RepID=A0A1Y1ZTX7_9PLEO|nr:hypothetical protein BCR34DRAFT_255081 [Clohesyomyces aquaticus]